MIKGIGTDIVSIQRFSKAMDKWGDKIVKRLFTKAELEYCNSKKYPEAHFAARFAAKEALFKALTGVAEVPTQFNKMEILNDNAGKPSMKVEGLQNFEILVTMSHEKEFATSTVIIQLSSTGL